MTPEPGTVRKPTEIIIAAENQIVCKTRGAAILEACVVFMAVCYVFMFHYPPPAKNFCLNWQKSIQQIKDVTKLPINIANLVIIKFVHFYRW